MLKKLTLSFAIASTLLISSVQATTFRTLTLVHLAKVGTFKDSYGFKGIVQKIEDQPGMRKVTFLVEDALQGNLKSKQTLVLNFPNSKTKQSSFVNYRLQMLQPVPEFTSQEKVVLFTTRNVHGEDFFVGGEAQSRFFVEEKNGKTYVHNSLHNQNLLTSLPDHFKKDFKLRLEKTVQENPEGKISFEDFKTMLTEASK